MMQSERPDEGRSDPAARNVTLVAGLLREGHIRTPSVEAAFRAVPRHLFLPNLPLDEVYRDDAIVTKRLDGVPVSSSSQPAIMAIMLEQLDLHPGQRVLEIGAGTGYNAALIASIVGERGRVTAIDIDEDIVDGARAHLAAAGLARVRVLRADGGHGYAPDAPYDRIILSVGAWDLLPAWVEQLAPEGRIVLPLSIRVAQRAIAFQREGHHLVSVSLYECGFMRLRGAFAGAEGSLMLSAGPGVSVTVDDRALVDSDRLAALLGGAWQEEVVAPRTTPAEAFGSLGLWIAGREPRFCMLTAPAAQGDAQVIPCLVLSAGGCATHGVLGEDALSVLMRSDEGSPPPSASPTAPFPLKLRSYGRDDALVRRLRGHIAAWDAAGRPGDAALRVRAYPAGTHAPMPAGAVVVEKRWSRLMLEWNGGRSAR